MMMRKWNENITTLVFSLNDLEILHKERKRQVNTMVMQYLKSILFHESEPANEQHTYQSITSKENSMASYENQMLPVVYSTYVYVSEDVYERSGNN